MSSSKPNDDIVKSDPTGRASSSNSIDKITEADSPQEVGAVASNATVATNNAGKRTELTDIATLHNIDFGDPVLDPSSPDFDVYEWAKTVMRAAGQAGVKTRRVSFVFKKLVVSGSRSTTRFQANVASIFMVPFRLHEYINSRKKPEKAILHGFDGMTKPGEILLVLGRPGSGCSTFLKTVSGELHGLKVNKDSEIVYNGIASMTNIHRTLVLIINKVFPKRK
jgi:ABC-type ATPase with predicted acetyltransferase domain